MGYGGVLGCSGCFKELTGVKDMVCQKINSHGTTILKAVAAKITAGFALAIPESLYPELICTEKTNTATAEDTNKDIALLEKE